MSADARTAWRWWLTTWALSGIAGGLLLYAWTQHVRGTHTNSHLLWTLVIALTVAAGLATASLTIREPTKAIPARSWLIGIAGMLAGSTLFAVDTAVEQLHLGPEDLHFWIECAEFTIIGPGLGMLCLLLVERLHATRAAAKARELEERERRFLVLGRMAAAVAHEVRNPLHTLRLVVDELRVEHPSLRSHPLSAHIDDSLERIDRAVDLVYQLARPGVEDDGAGDLVVTVHAALAALALNAGNHTICLRLMPDRAPVRCSASGLHIMVDNLLRNAVQATTVGDPITIDLRSEGGRWLLRLANPGSLPDQRAVYTGENPVASSKTDGLGLGLIITRQLAANAGGALMLTAHGGMVTAELALPAWKASIP